MAEHFHALRVAEVVPETSEANSIRFEIPQELRERFAFRAGQHLTLRATIDGEERSYAVTGTKGYEWMEAETVQKLGLEDSIDYGYFDDLVAKAVKAFEDVGYPWS